MELHELTELGLTEGQIKVYGAILELGIAGVQDIQAKASLERRAIYDILNKLIDKGFVTFTIEKKIRKYQCTHPRKIEQAIADKQGELDKLTAKMPAVEELFSAQRPNIMAEVYRGNEAMKALLDEALEYDESHWIGGNSGVELATGIAMKLWFKQWNDRRVQRGHIMHDLVDHGTYLEDFPPDAIEKHKQFLYKYCQLPKNLQSPMVTIMFGNKVAQVLWSKQSFCVVIESVDIKESFMRYFHHFWKDPW